MNHLDARQLRLERLYYPGGFILSASGGLFSTTPVWYLQLSSSMSSVVVQDPSVVISKLFLAQTPPDPSCGISLNPLEKLYLHLHNPLSVSPVV